MSMVSLAEVRQHLNIATDASDTKLQATIDAAESYIARRIGAGSTLAQETVTQRVNGFRSVLTLTTLPVISVTSVTGSDGVLVPLSGLDVDTAAGIIRSNATYYYSQPYYPFLLPFYTVVYQAGYAAPLAYDFVQAVKEVTRQLWGSQRGGQRGSGDPTEIASAMTNANILIDNLQTPGFA
jgi:hypothetical protein